MRPSVLTAESLIMQSLWFFALFALWGSLRVHVNVSTLGFHRSCEEIWWGNSGQTAKRTAMMKYLFDLYFRLVWSFSTIFLIYFSFILSTCQAKSTVKTVSNPSLTEFELTRKSYSLILPKWKCKGCIFTHSDNSELRWWYSLHRDDKETLLSLLIRICLVAVYKKRQNSVSRPNHSVKIFLLQSV